MWEVYDVSVLLERREARARGSPCFSCTLGTFRACLRTRFCLDLYMENICFGGVLICINNGKFPSFLRSIIIHSNNTSQSTQNPSSSHILLYTLHTTQHTKMQFSTALLTATAALLTTVTADGVFGISGTAIVSSPTVVNLTVLNGLVGDAPTCQGSSEVSPLPNSGIIPCKEGYSLTWTWKSITEGIQATYATPSSPAFTYNVPNLGCDGAQPNTCKFGFENIFPGFTRISFKA